MALVCNPQGQIEVAEMMTAINKNETDIANNTASDILLSDRVLQNETDIVSLNSRIVNIENQDIAAVEARVTVNEANILTDTANTTQNTLDISTNAVSISDNFVSIQQNITDIANNKAEIDINTAANTAHETAIADHETRIATLEASTGLSQELLLVNETAGGVNGGTSVAGTWTARNIQTERHNSLGATVGSTSVTLDAGTYKVEAMAVATGSEHQSRISIGGSLYIYGMSLDSSGASIVNGKFELLAPSVVELETNVTTAVVDTGFGKASSFGTPNVYTSIHIIKVG